MCLHAWVHALTCVWTVAQGLRSIQSTDCLHLCQFYLGNWLTPIHSVPVTTAFLFAGRWCTTTGESISGNSYHSQNENMSGLKSACSNQIRQRKYNVYVCFRVSLCHSTLCACTDVEHVHFRRVVPAFRTVFIGTASVAWIKRAGQLAADDVASVWTLWVQSPLGPRQSVGFFVGYRPFPATREKQYEYLCMYACVYVYMHIRMPACLSPCTSRMRLQWYCPIFTVRRITSNTNMVYAKTHFTIRSDI